jgi:hypothetical protein
MMIVSELKKLIADLPDDTPIFTIVDDHQAVRSQLYYGHVVQEERNYFSEYFGDSYLDPGDIKVQALIVD